MSRWSILLVLAVPAFRPMFDPDFFWHVKVGEWILAHQAFPAHDLFTYTVASHPFVTHEWLSEVIMAGLFYWGGIAPVIVFFGLLSWGAFILLSRSCAPNTSSGFTLLALVLGVVAGMPIWGPRSQMITFAFTVLELFLLRQYSRGGERRYLLALPVLFLAWSNLHGGFFLGLAILALRLFSMLFEPGGRPRFKALLYVSAACLAAVAINPNGLAIFPYSLATQSSPEQQRLIVEWHSPDFHAAEARGFEAMLLVTVAAFIAVRKKPPLMDVLLVVAGAALAFQSERHIALFVAMSVAPLADCAQNLWEENRRRLPSLRLPPDGVGIRRGNLLVILTVAAVTLPLVFQAASTPLDSPENRKSFPIAAMDFVAGNPPPGNGLNMYHWGGYFIYRAWPKKRAFIYGDAAVMGDPFLREFENLAYVGPGYEAGLESRKIDWMLFPVGTPVVSVLSRSPAWGVEYDDGVATILVRRSAAPLGYIPARPYGKASTR